MTDLYGPFDGTPWAQDQWYRHASAWAPSGVFGSSAATSTTTGDLALTVSGRNVTIGTGRAWVRGAGFERTGTPASQAVSANTNTTLSRRDRVVLRRDLATKTIAPVLLTGTPAATPVAPSITQSETGQWDLLLYSFLVPPNSGTTLSGIVDERLWMDPGGGSEWTNGAELLRVGAVSLSNNALEAQGFGTGDVVKDVGGYYTGSGATTLTVPAGLGGLYLISVSSGISGGPIAARFFLSVYINGAESFRANGYGDDSANGAKTLRLASGATIGVQALQAGGSARTLSGLALNVHRLGT